jgi:Cft2 family RNA processing exonuclease
MDHSGALPLLLATLPGVPVYCTPPTAQLIRFAEAKRSSTAMAAKST